MITAKGITKQYGQLKVLKGIDLHIDKGEIVSIVGPSGAGKTTLLQILGTLDNPNTGELYYEEQNILQMRGNKLSVFRNKNIGFVFQFHQLLPEFTALENICIPAFILGEQRKEAERRSKELLEYLGLSGRGSHKPSELSGGEQQRVAVARALINRPSVVLADEPSGNLDSASSAELHRLFFDLRDAYGQSFVIVTHNTELANMADRKLSMKNGLMV